jgi:chitin synthase
MVNPYWMEGNKENRSKCQILAEAQVEHIPEQEVAYWNSFIHKYLRPLNEDKEEKKRISQGLLELRNQATRLNRRVNLRKSSLNLSKI